MLTRPAMTPRLLATFAVVPILAVSTAAIAAPSSVPCAGADAGSPLAALCALVGNLGQHGIAGRPGAAFRRLSELASAGNVERRVVDPPGYGNETVETFQYDGQKRLVRWTLNPPGYGNETTETFDYDSAGRLTRWTINPPGYANETRETFQYDSEGRLTRWTHNPPGYGNETTETFEY